MITSETKENTLDLLEHNGQYSPWLKDISKIIDYASIKKKHFFDFGCGVGAWTLVASKTFEIFSYQILFFFQII
jgi:tRNA A58 N-methylase Trm61